MLSETEERPGRREMMTARSFGPSRAAVIMPGIRLTSYRWMERFSFWEQSPEGLLAAPSTGSQVAAKLELSKGE